MKSIAIKISNGNAGTKVTYDEKQSSIFWSEQSTYCWNDKAVNFNDSKNAFDRNLSALLKVPKISSK